MPVAFPAVAPTSMSFSAPEWPTTSSRSQSGVTTRRLWGDKSSNAELTLEFANKADDDVEAILAAFETAQGATDTLTLPAEFWTGRSAALRARLEAPGLAWAFQEGQPPEVSAGPCGTSTVRLTLRAELYP